MMSGGQDECARNAIEKRQLCPDVSRRQNRAVGKLLGLEGGPMLCVYRRPGIDASPTQRSKSKFRLIVQQVSSVREQRP